MVRVNSGPGRSARARARRSYLQPLVRRRSGRGRRGRVPHTGLNSRPAADPDMHRGRGRGRGRRGGRGWAWRAGRRQDGGWGRGEGQALGRGWAAVPDQGPPASAGVLAAAGVWAGAAGRAGPGARAPRTGRLSSPGSGRLPLPPSGPPRGRSTRLGPKRARWRPSTIFSQSWTAGRAVSPVVGNAPRPWSRAGPRRTLAGWPEIGWRSG